MVDEGKFFFIEENAEGMVLLNTNGCYYHKERTSRHFFCFLIGECTNTYEIVLQKPLELESDKTSISNNQMTGNTETEEWVKLHC